MNVRAAAWAEDHRGADGIRPVDDAQIVELYLSRDESAIEETARKYGAQLRGLALRLLADFSSAEECENDTYHRAWNLIPPHEPRDYLFAFLGRITRHLAIDLCRKRHSQKRSGLVCELTREMEACIPSPGDSVESALDADALRQCIDAFLATCTPEQRVLFIRRYWFFDSIAEIGRRYHISQSKVKVTLFRVRKSLRIYLEKEGYRL